MLSRTSDFLALFQTLWYRDFPVTHNHLGFAKRADWTTHIASTVRQISSIMGLYSCFESGGRTDAEMHFNSRKVWAKLEWEWDEPREKRTGEIHKLAAASAGSTLCVFIGYSQSKYHEANLEKIRAAWVGVEKPLVVFLITFELDGPWRHFDQLQTYSCSNSEISLLREQPALPWMVKGSRWEIEHE